MEENNNEENLSLSQNFLQNVYSKLTVNDDSLFDVKNESQLVETVMTECFDKEFLLIETSILQNNSVLINNNLVKFIKHCLEKHKNKKIGILFIGFCDYFALDYNKTYIILHEKLQTLIKLNAKKLCGNDVYLKEELKNPTVKTGVYTLFDLVKK